MLEFIPALDQEFTLVSGLHSTPAMFKLDGQRGEISLFIRNISAISTIGGGRINVDGMGKYGYKISNNIGRGMLVSYGLQVSNLLDVVSGRAEPMEEPIAPETKEDVRDGIVDAKLDNMVRMLHVFLNDIEQVKAVLKEGR